MLCLFLRRFKTVIIHLEGWLGITTHATKLDDSSLTPKTNMVEGEN